MERLMFREEEVSSPLICCFLGGNGGTWEEETRWSVSSQRQ